MSQHGQSISLSLSLSDSLSLSLSLSHTHTHPCTVATDTIGRRHTCTRLSPSVRLLTRVTNVSTRPELGEFSIRGLRPRLAPVTPSPWRELLKSLRSASSTSRNAPSSPPLSAAGARNRLLGRGLQLAALDSASPSCPPRPAEPAPDLPFLADLRWTRALERTDGCSSMRSTSEAST